MASGGYVDRRNDDHYSQPRGFLTPPPTWRTNRNRRSPVIPRSEMKPKTTPQQSRGDQFHIVHKIPAGDSPYVRAKHVQLVEKDPGRAISLFWAAINAGDRVDSALKDMAVVMKQVNRSDEAIEAIKSFRHLSPHESQESIDNILVELYKQSGRIEEEIDLLQHKLKQVEEGMAFSGRKTKMARSQGKKVQITVQKEYSRLLGNLAWAYMQNGDFKSAEEHYRKALSFEADKNKQCNLAICLMHTNKLSEAKFLLETIPSENGAVDESYAKSYERASEILAEFESQRMLRPTKQMQQNNEKRADFGYEKRADFDWRMNHHGPSSFCNRDIPKAPLTQPRRCPRWGDQRKPDSTETGQSNYCRKLSFESSSSTSSGETVQFNYSAYSAPDEMPNIFPHFLEKKNPPLKPAEANDEGMNSLPCKVGKNHNKKSWADMVEEDELEFAAAMDQEKLYNDENLDSNIAEEMTKETGMVDLGEGYLTQPDKTEQSKNHHQPLRRSLCFDQNHISDLQKLRCSSPLDFEGQDGNQRNWRRLQVFQDITQLHGSPRP